MNESCAREKGRELALSSATAHHSSADILSALLTVKCTDYFKFVHRPLFIEDGPTTQRKEIVECQSRGESE